MALVTEEEVEAIIDVDSSLDLTEFIDTAHVIVSEELTPLDIYSNDRLTKIELWLAAHFVACRQRQLEQEWIGDAKQYFSGKFGMDLRFTQYGQQVMFLDTEGIFTSLQKPKMTFNAL